jgi:hypothetical protein
MLNVANLVTLSRLRAELRGSNLKVFRNMINIIVYTSKMYCTVRLRAVC